MDPLAQAVERIIQEQEKIIGPVALEQAKKVRGISVDWVKHEVTLSGDEKAIVESLVRKYETLFGRASIEVCKEAIETIKDKIPPKDFPDILKA